ncbi:hypothetical protein Acy02nite_74600 [Actinoplanes cyaneus]|uniref:Uncharacterized protein n=1 Tax=Actinoplanes cyaneus TaxID=52696 RepID=A0A919IPU3_9ACTN|nr:hypothetical protein [Actinoplanes cyaneus]GID69579.1 hypothetical protein Acy02nite_74600 [Actinoplanes cyaneus]
MSNNDSEEATNSTAARKLERRYRRVLRVYPAGRRREELLDTLLEMAPPSRAWPTTRETADLVRRGLRARLGRPASRAVVVVAVMVALVTGYLAAAFAVRGAWEAVPDYPSGGKLAEITGTVFPGLQVDGSRDAGGLFHDLDEPSTLDVVRHGHEEDFGYAEYNFAPAAMYIADDYHTWMTETARRLTEAGWTVQDVSPTGATVIATGKLDESGTTLTADRGNLHLYVGAETDVVGTPVGSFYADANLTRMPAWYVPAAGALGWLAGGLIGWLLTGWASRRTERAASSRVRALTTALTGVALFFLLPLAILGLLGFVDEFWITRSPGAGPFWSLGVTWFYGCQQLGTLLGLVALVLAAFARPHHSLLPDETTKTTSKIKNQSPARE